MQYKPQYLCVMEIITYISQCFCENQMTLGKQSDCGRAQVTKCSVDVSYFSSNIVIILEVYKVTS